jgi:PAS domain S-box-containing protein
MKPSVLSLRLLFILIVSLISFFLTVTLTYVTSKQYKKEAVEQLIHHVTMANQDFSYAIADDIITENFSSLQEFVLSSRHRYHQKEISIITPGGIIIADSRPERLGEVVEIISSGKAETVLPEVNLTSDTLFSLTPVSLDGILIGWCRTIVDTKHLRDSIASLQKKVITWGAVTWMFAVVIVILVAAFITRPIHKIMTAAQEISSGNFGGKTDVSGPVEISRLAVAFNTMTDELKKREHLLKLSENKYKSLVEDINDWVWEMDENMAYTYSSPSVERMLGYRVDEVIGKTPYDFMAADEAARVRSYLSSFDRVVAHKDFFNTKLHKNGKEVVIEISGHPIIGKDGRFKGYQGLSRDVTEKRQAARERKKLEQQLHQAQKMEAIGTLAGGIAHDFNNILSSILGYAEIIKMEVPEGGQTARDIGQVIAGGNRATELVKQILTFSRKTEQRKQPLRIDIIIKEALKLLRSSLPTSIAIETDIKQDCNLVYADPTNIHQVIVNLCTNGSQAIGNAKGRLVVTLSQVELVPAQLVDHADIEAGEFVVLSVEDTGKGMDEITRSRIFEPYFTSKGLGEGTGLGLAVIHGIVEDCNGFVEVESVPDEGTVFRVFFPVVADDVAVVAEEVDNAPMPGGDEKILVVDDEPDLTTITKIFLTRLGYTVETAVTSLDALEKFKLAPASFDLLITDQTMPGMSGIELAQAVLELNSEVPIILCSGYTAALSADEVSAFGIACFVRKPLGKRKLAEIVRQVLDGDDSPGVS